MQTTAVPGRPTLDLGYLELYVSDLQATSAQFTDQYSFRPAGTRGGDDDGFRSIALTQGRLTLVLTQGLADEHPATGYVLSHGDGVADIALHSRDAAASFAVAVQRAASHCWAWIISRSASGPASWPTA